MADGKFVKANTVLNVLVYFLYFERQILSKSEPKLLYDCQSVRLGVELALGLVIRYYFLSEDLSESCGLVSMGRPL
jgi:hypothetical protein